MQCENTAGNWKGWLYSVRWSDCGAKQQPPTGARVAVKHWQAARFDPCLQGPARGRRGWLPPPSRAPRQSRPSSALSRCRLGTPCCRACCWQHLHGAVLLEHALHVAELPLCVQHQLRRTVPNFSQLLPRLISAHAHQCSACAVQVLPGYDGRHQGHEARRRRHWHRSRRRHWRGSQPRHLSSSGDAC